MFAGKLLYYNFHELSNSFKLFVFFFLVISSTISTIFVYRNRPFTNPRCIQLTNCILKFTSLSLIYISVSDKDLFFMTIFGFFTLKISCKLLNLIKAAIFYNSKKSNRRFLTVEEYGSQSNEFTKKQLTELRRYCLYRAECNSWRIISVLKNPDK